MALPTRATLSAYAARADEYVDAVGRIEHVSKSDLDFVQTWANGVDGRIVDVGSGPGQWTNYLRECGAEIVGVDPVREFVDRARTDYPETEYRVGKAEHLAIEDGALGGVLAWYSLIHTSPSEIGLALSEFARALRPGGRLLLGFFTAEHQAAFDHAIAPAYYWPVEMLVERVEEAGFRVTHTETRVDRPARTHGALTAIRNTGGQLAESEQVSVFNDSTS